MADQRFVAGVWKKQGVLTSDGHGRTNNRIVRLIAVGEMLTSRLTAQVKFLFSLFSNRNFWVIAFSDILLIILVHYLAYYIRFDGNLGGWSEKIIKMLPILLLIKLPFFYFCGLYRGMWRYTSFNDIVNIGVASLLSTAVVILYLVYSEHIIGFSRSVFIIDGILTFLLISLQRASIRFFQNSQSHLQTNILLRPLTEATRKDKKRILLVGAGDASDRIIREIHDNRELPYRVVALVDDDSRKVGRKIHGIPVVGLLNDLKEHARRMRVDEIFITIASATGEQMKRIIRLCQESDFDFKVMPGLGRIIDGRVSVKSMREVSYRDLLGRKEVTLDVAKIGSYITGKTILVTGAGGSIGSELCRQLLRFSPAKILLFDASEENLYDIQMELHHEHEFTSYETILGKVQSSGLLETVFAQHTPEVVFHAAAYKHVPLLERNPWEAVFNNIRATQKLIAKAIEHRVERFVIVSTDKAVRPTNVMGASKRVTELLMLAYGSTEDCRTIFQAVRFGNVLGSSGSVIPLFKKQIELGGPVTVTHPEITRFFMSVEEAAQLVLQAGGMGTGNEIFLLKMGEPIKIDNMARELIRLAGKEPEIEIMIKYTGLREGEKLYEELITEGEGIVETEHDKIMVLQSDAVEAEKILKGVGKLVEHAKKQNVGLIKNTIRELVPEYIIEKEI